MPCQHIPVRETNKHNKLIKVNKLITAGKRVAITVTCLNTWWTDEPRA